MKNYVALREAVKVTGLHPNTLRKYADDGTIESYKLPNGARRFDLSGFVNQRGAVICYARVSTPKQKEDLDRQCTFLKQRYPDAELIRDIGSGINYKRKGLRSILERAIRGDRITLVVTYRDRLVRFGFDLLEWIIERAHGEIVVLNQIDTSPMDELTRDLVAIITVFSSRIHGLRSHKIKKDIAKTVSGATTDT